MAEEKEEVYEAFYNNVNMQPKEIEEWLETEESKSVGQNSGDGESKGRKSAKKIIDIKRTKKDELTDSDYEHMQKVNAYVARHTADSQRPSSDVEESDWRYSLMNWGHDPLK